MQRSWRGRVTRKLFPTAVDPFSTSGHEPTSFCVLSLHYLVTPLLNDSKDTVNAIRHDQTFYSLLSISCRRKAKMVVVFQDQVEKIDVLIKDSKSHSKVGDWMLSGGPLDGLGDFHLEGQDDVKGEVWRDDSFFDCSFWDDHREIPTVPQSMSPKLKRKNRRSTHLALHGTNVGSMKASLRRKTHRSRISFIMLLTLPDLSSSIGIPAMSTIRILPSRLVVVASSPFSNQANSSSISLSIQKTTTILLC